MKPSRCEMSLCSGGFCQERLADAPFVQFAARGAMNTHVLLPDAQQGADLALNAAVDTSTGRGAHENEMFHGIPHPRLTSHTSSCQNADNANARFAGVRLM